MEDLTSLEEATLYNLHVTHHSEMDKLENSEKQDNIQKQITAFEKLLQHCMNRFSNEKLYQMLKLVLQGMPALKDHDAAQITSKRQLQDIVESLPDANITGLTKEDEVHMVKYFNTFFNDLEYLEEMKEYFDERIYTCLYEYYYDPLEDKGNVNIAPVEEMEVEELDESNKLAYAVRKLYHVDMFWDKLFTEEQLEVKYFDPDSFHELVQFQNITEFEMILRLVPDIFVKSFKSVELAKLWLTQANKLYPQLPLKRNTAKSFQKMADNLEEEIIQLDSDIDKEKELLTIHEDDMRLLEGRESRFSDINKSCEDVELKRNRMGRQYNEFLTQRKSLTEEIEFSREGTSKYRRIKGALDKLKLQIPSTEEELKLLSFNYDILQEDFQIELEVRPTVIRYVDRLREKVIELEESIRKKVSNKRNTEKQLELLRTNTERMRNIIRKHIKSVRDDNDDDGDDDKFTYSADDETDIEARKQRRLGHGHRKSQERQKDEDKDENTAKHKSNHEYRKNVATKEKSRKPREHDNQKTEIPVSESQFAKGTSNSKRKKARVSPNKDNSGFAEPQLTPRDERTNKPIRNKDPALIKLKPGAKRTSPDSGLGAEKSRNQSLKEGDTHKTTTKPKTRLPQPASRLKHKQT